MTAMTERSAEPAAWLGSLFDRIVCGVDGTESSRVAVAQAARLLSARRTLDLIGVVDRSPVAALASWVDPADLERQYKEARRALSEGREQCSRAHARLLAGDPGPALVSTARKSNATLAVGAPPSGRLGGIVLGSVGTHLLHNAPCSVLIARPSGDEAAFPRSIVVGHDGSSGAVAAVAVAKELAHRFGAALRILVAEGGDPVQIDALAREKELAWSFLAPTEALTVASADADLIVVGSRGLRGVHALGSVSERIGHLARCSVLVVREPLGTPATVTVTDDAVPDSEC